MINLENKTNELAVKDLIKQFKASNDIGYFRLDRVTVGDRLTELVNDPNKIQQGRLSLCGPAAFFQLLIKRDPLTFVQYATSLYNNGFGKIGNMIINPGHNLKNQDHNEEIIQNTLNWMKIKGIRVTKENKKRFISPPADWMVMSSLKDEANIFLEYKGTLEEELAGITLLGDLEAWLKATSLYQSVLVDASWIKSKGINHAKSLIKSNNKDIILFINSRMLSKNVEVTSSKKLNEIILNAFPNHYIILTSIITETEDNHMKFSCWTWGKIKEYEVPKKVFKTNYYGAIIAEV